MQRGKSYPNQSPRGCSIAGQLLGFLARKMPADFCFFCVFFAFSLRYVLTCADIYSIKENDMTFFCLLVGACLIGLCGAEMMNS